MTPKAIVKQRISFKHGVYIFRGSTLLSALFLVLVLLLYALAPVYPQPSTRKTHSVIDLAGVTQTGFQMTFQSVATTSARVQKLTLALAVECSFAPITTPRGTNLVQDTGDINLNQPSACWQLEIATLTPSQKLGLAQTSPLPQVIVVRQFAWQSPPTLTNNLPDLPFFSVVLGVNGLLPLLVIRIRPGTGTRRQNFKSKPKVSHSLSLSQLSILRC